SAVPLRGAARTRCTVTTRKSLVLCRIRQQCYALQCPEFWTRQYFYERSLGPNFSDSEIYSSPHAATAQSSPVRFLLRGRYLLGGRKTSFGGRYRTLQPVHRPKRCVCLRSRYRTVVVCKVHGPRTLVSDLDHSGRRSWVRGHRTH